MHTIKSVGVLSVAKIMGVTYAVLGLLFMPFFLLAGLAGSMAGGRDNPFGTAAGLAFGIMAPIVYGVLGFIGGAISAFVYNLMTKWIGGIQLELQSG